MFLCCASFVGTLFSLSILFFALFLGRQIVGICYIYIFAQNFDLKGEAAKRVITLLYNKHCVYLCCGLVAFDCPPPSLHLSLSLKRSANFHQLGHGLMVWHNSHRDVIIWLE